MTIAQPSRIPGKVRRVEGTAPTGSASTSSVSTVLFPNKLMGTGPFEPMLNTLALAWSMIELPCTIIATPLDRP